MINNLEYRILGIDKDGNIRLLDVNKHGKSTPWDDRFNIDKNTSAGINDYIANDINSRIKDAIDEIYTNPEIITNDIKPYFVTHSACIGKRAEDETSIDGSVECSQN